MGEMSRILPEEEEQARKLMEVHMVNLTGSKEMPTPCGYLVCLKVYIRPDELAVVKRDDGSEVTLWTPPVTQMQDKYQSVAALVMAVGPDAYKGTLPDGTPRYPQPWCKVGDWVLIPRYEGLQFTWKGKVAMVMLPDDKILAVIDDPSHVTATHLIDKV